MKRFLLFWIFVLMVLVVFAQGQTSRNDANGQAQREPNTHVTVVQAREVGLKFLNANARTPLRCANELQLATTYQTSHGDEAFYVFNTQNGFVMVAADRCATPILGYSDEGAFDVNNVPIQMQSYLQGFVEQIAYGQEHNVTTDARVEQQWQQVRATGRLSDTRSNESVEPLITAKWDQGCYYNDKCPEDSNGYCGGHVPTGCAATAMGMIMHYWKYPIHGNGSISQCYAYYPTQNVDFAATTYDWNNMPDQLDSNSTQVQIDAVSTLLWHCGVAVRMAYSPLSSAAMNLAIEPAFKNYFMYSEDLYLATRNDDTEWLFKIKTELLHQRPIYYMGDTHQSGHAFVCDGFDENDFLHFNWGWSGYNNGYFALHEMTLEDNYGFFNQAIFNLRPSCDSTVVYHVSTNCVPSNGGVVSGGAGNYSCGQVCNLIAEPSQGYFFLNWMENGNVISTDPRYTFDVIGNKSLVANFIIPDTFTISATSNPQNAGVISGTGEYPFSATCVLSATPDTGYFFVNWTENGEVVSTESTYSFSVSNERNLTANFTLPFSITVTASPNSGGITTGMGYYDYGSMCTVSATPNSGYVFLRWVENGEVVSFVSDYSFEVIGNRDLVAEFVTSFVISASAASSSGGGVITGTGQYDYGQMCSLTAHPNEGCSFLRWTENGNVVSVDSNYSFVVTNNRNLVAHFTSDQTCEIVLEMNYWFYPDNYLVLDYGDGTSELFTVTEGIDSSFMRTVVNYSTVDLSWFSGTNPYSCKYNLSYGNGAPIIQCYFPFETSPYSFVVDCIEANSPCTVYVTTNAEDRGTASGGGLYQIGQNCIVNAIPQEGYEFLNWSENGEVVSYNSEYSFTVTKSRNLVACFDKLDSICTLIFDFSDGGLLSWMDGKVILEYDGISEELSAGIYHRRIINGSHIKMTWNVIDYISDSWSVSAYYENGSTALPPSPPPTDFYSSVIYEFDVDCEAAYSSYFVLAQADAPEKGSVSGMGEFGAGETCTLVAVSNPGYTFMYWTENGEIVSYQAEYSFHVYDNRNLVANFLMPLTIDVSVDNPDNGIVNGSGEYAYGTTCTLTAIPNSDYVFLKWTENGVTVSTASEYSFTVTEGRDLVAHFIEPDSVCDILFKLFWSEYDRFLVVTYEDGGYEKLTVNAGDAFNAVHKRTVPKRSYLSLSWESPGESFFGCSFYVYYENGLLIYQGSEADVNYVNGFLSDIEVDCEGAYVSRSINAIPNIPAGGVIQGEGTYETGEICILKAMPNEGYSFLYWTENDEIVSNESFYPFVVTDDRTLVAHFSLPYHVTVVPDKEEGGSVVGGGAYVYGQTCIVTASKSDNYTFLNWTENGRIVSADSVYSFRVSADCNLVAHFVNSDSICNLVFDLYSPFFDGWDDAQLFVNYGNDIYEEFTLTSTREGSFSRTVEEGSHISLSWFLDYPRSFEVHYDNGVPIFDSDDSEDWTWNNYEFDIDCAGAYSPRTIQVFVDSSDRGTANGEGTYESGQICTLMAVPNSGYIFDCWTINGEIVSYEPTYSFVVTEDGTFVANFIEECLGRYVVIDLYWHWSLSHELILEHNGISEQFTVDPICDSATFYRFLPGATHVSLSFVEGLVPWLSSFAVRYRDGGVIYQSSYPYENLPFEFDVDSLPMCPERIVSVTSNPEIGGFVTGGGSYNHGDTCTLIAVPNEGYCFVEWTNQGMEISNNDILIFPVFGNTEYVAHFVPNSFSFADTSCVSYVWNDIIYMETGDYEQTFIASNGCDSAVTLHLTINNPVYSAVADTACESFTWEGNTYAESGDYTSYKTNAAGCDSIVTLHLTIIPYDTITLAVNDTLMGSVALAGVLPEGAADLGGGSYRVPRGTELTVKALFDTADFGFLFWTRGNDTLSVDSVYTFTVMGSDEYTAHFEYLPTPYFYVSKTGWATWINPHSGPGAFTRVDVKAANSDQWETLNYSSSITCVQIPSFMLTDSTLYTVRAVLYNYEPSFESREVTFDWFYVACDHFEGVSNFEGEITDQGVALSWDAGEGPQQYLLYRNYSIIDTLTTTSYIDTSGVYSNKYYVRRMFGGSAVCPYNNDSLSMSCQTEARIYIDLTLTTDPPMFGTAAFVLPDNTGHVAIGGTCTVSATANEGYSFTHWTFNGTKVSVQSTYSFDVEQEGELVAHFEYAPATDLYVSRTGWASWNNSHSQPGDNSCVSAQVTLKSIDGQVLFTQTFSQPSANHCQLPTGNFADSTLYLMSVVLADTAGNSSEATTQWYYVACDHLSGFDTVSGVFGQQGVNLSWDYPSSMTFTTATVDYDLFNGFVTDTAVMSNGGDASWAVEPQSTAGPYCNYASNVWVGDRITLSDTTRISEMEVYAFQNDFSTTSPFTGLYIQIYQGSPADSVLVWGNADSNLMTATAFTGCYRGLESNSMIFNLRRPIMSLTASGLDIELSPGTYYFVWSVSVSNTINPVAIPHCEPVVGNTGDYGMLYTEDHGWHTMHDGGSGEPFGFAFHLTGEQVLSPVVEPEATAIYRNGELIDITSSTTYTDSEGSADHSYEVRVVYGGDRHCVYGNAAMSMSCPQPVTLHCGETFTGDTTAVACESFTWYGTTYTETPTVAPTHTLTNASGCDSVVTLHLTINTSVAESFEAIACDSYTWNGETYTESGDYIQTFTAVNGCDSVVTLHLTVNPSFSIEAYLTISENDLPFTYGDTTFMSGTVQSGDYIFNFTTADGCDSVIILHLTVETGINDYSLNASMKLYPNPTKDLVNVQLTMNNEQLEGVNIQVFDIYGRLLEVVNMADARGASLQTAQIDLSRYANGVYLVKAVAEGNVLAVRKVVKR